MKDRRSTPEQKELSEDLIKQGVEQLENEIRILQDWLSGLEETREDNPASIAARKTYTDMLQSRQEFLDSIKKK